MLHEQKILKISLPHPQVSVNKSKKVSHNQIKNRFIQNLLLFFFILICSILRRHQIFSSFIAFFIFFFNASKAKRDDEFFVDKIGNKKFEKKKEIKGLNGIKENYFKILKVWNGEGRVE